MERNQSRSYYLTANFIQHFKNEILLTITNFSVKEQQQQGYGGHGRAFEKIIASPTVEPSQKRLRNL